MSRKGKARSKAGKPLYVGEADVGWYKTKLVSGGPWVPCRIYDEDGEMKAEVDGRPEEMAGDVPASWPWHPSTRFEFDYLTSLRIWTEKHDPQDPMAKPRERIDIRKMRPPL